MPELNEDILEGESNPELLNQAEDSASLDESGAATTDDQLGMEVDPNDPKPEESMKCFLRIFFIKVSD